LTVREAQTTPRGDLNTAISNMMVRLMSEYTGRGPTKTRTYVHEDVVTIVMRDTLTKAEHKLAASGRADSVRATRRLFQDAMRDDVIAGVTALTGRQVFAFLSDNHIEPDVAVETILLAPASGPQADR
jgi:uncharacterized protein YbcI